MMKKTLIIALASLGLSAPVAFSAPNPATPSLALNTYTTNAMWGSNAGVTNFIQTVRDNGTCPGGFITMGDRKTSLWASNPYNMMTLGSEAQGEGSDYNTAGYVLGGDYAVCPVMKLGASFGQTFGKTKIDHTEGDIKQDQTMGALYSQIRLGKTESTTTSLIITGAIASDDTRSTLDQTIGNWKNDSYFVEARALCSFSISEKLTLYTFGGLQYQATHQGAFSDSLGTTYTSEDLSALRLNFGAGAFRTLGKSWFLNVMVSAAPDLFRGDSPSVGVNPGYTAFQGNAALMWAICDQVSMNVAYYVDMRPRYLDQSIRWGVKVSF